MQILQKPTELIIDYANNARTHTQEQVDKVAASIKAFGFNNPILIDDENVIIAGHCRLMAAKKLEMAQVPTIELSHLSKAEKAAYVLADNRLAEMGASWNMELVNLELEFLNDAGFNLDLTGFELPEKISEGLVDDDQLPDAIENTKTKPGDVWVCGQHRVMCGDSCSIDDTNKLLNNKAVDLIFTDPPYGISIVSGQNKIGGDAPTKFGKIGGENIVESTTYKHIQGDDTIQAAQDFYNLCTASGYKNIILWGGNYFTSFLPPSRCWLIWNKEMTGNFSEAEMAWTSFSKGGVKVFKHLWNGLSREGNRKDELKKRVHPTQKPVGLFQEIFQRFDGFQSIYDGFGGSGSTLIAAQKLGRESYIMELDPDYCDVIVQRWQDYTGQDATLESTGQAFNE